MTTEQGPVSVRGLKDSEFGTPLRKFYGVLDGYYPDNRQYGTYNVLNFKELDVLESVEPYNFPIAQISIKMSDKKNSSWGIFGESLAALLKDDEDIKDTIGRRYGMEMDVGHVFGQNDAGEDMVGNPWKVFELEGAAATGVGAPSAADQAMKLLVGKTRAEFNKVAYADPIIRKDAALQRSITDKSFINSKLQLGEIVEDENGVFQLPAGGATEEPKA